MTTSVHSLIRRISRSSVREDFPAASLRFDWTVTILSALFIGGVYIDGWAHNHGKVDNSFFTPWHAMLYGAFAVVGTFLTLSMAWNITKGHSMRQALPRGYALSMVGVIVFGLGGVADLVWHTLFGIEATVDALISPTHLLLAFGITLITTGPIRAAGFRFAPESRYGWRALGPLVVSATLFLSTLIFFTQYAHPLVNPFASSQTGTVPTRTDLFMMNADGSGQTRLTVHPNEDHNTPAISPDGSKVAFSLQPAESKTSDIYVMNIDGTGQTRLTNVAGVNYNAAWSPDGSQIAFISRNDTAYEIYKVNADGSDPVGMASLMGNTWGMTWSPDAKQIAFSSQRDGNWNIYTMDTNGKNIKQLTTDGPDNFYPSWSPDGSKIVFDRNISDQSFIFVVNADGSGLTKVSDHEGVEPRWSADGSKIVFAAFQHNRSDIYTMNADGSNIKDVTNNAAFNSFVPAWSMDGKKIIYEVSVPSSGDERYFEQAIGVSSVLLQTALLMGVILFLVRHWNLPFGALGLMMTTTSVMVASFHDAYTLVPAAVIAGILADSLLWRFRPSLEHPGRYYLFAVAIPVIFYSLYFVDESFMVAARDLALPDSQGWVEDPTSLMHQRAFTDLSVEGQGLAVLNRGLPSVEVTESGSISLTLLRAVGWLSRDDLSVRRIAAGPLVPTPGAQCLGDYRYEYAILPHGGDWQQVYGSAYNYTVPVYARRADTHPGLDLREMNITRNDPSLVTTIEWPRGGNYPDTYSFVTINDPRLVLSAVYRSGDKLIVRCYNITRQPVKAMISFGVNVAEAYRVNLAEETLATLPITAMRQVEIETRGAEVYTLRVTPLGQAI